MQGVGRRRQRRLPRLLDHRLHPDRPAPRHQRRAEDAHRRGPRPGHQGLLRHHHQPHRRRDRLRRGRRTPTSTRRPSPYQRRRPATPFDDRDYAGTDTFPALDPATSFPYTPVFRTDGGRDVKVPAWLNDPTLYHNRGDSTFAGESSDVRRLRRPRRPVHRAPDGRRRDGRHLQGLGRPRHRRLPDRHRQAREHRVLAAVLAGDARRTPDAAGNDDFFMFGEVFDANPAFLSPLHDRRPACTRPSTSASSRRRTGFAKGNADDRAARPVRRRRLVHRHRLQRLRAADLPRQPRHGPHRQVPRRQRRDGDELLRATELAHALMYLTRGQPVVYYGDEQGFVGAGGDKDARQDMFATQVAVVQRRRPDRHRRHHGRGQLRHRPPALPAHRRPVARCGREHPALADGAQIHRYAERRRRRLRVQPHRRRRTSSSTSSPSTTRRPTKTRRRSTRYSEHGTFTRSVGRPATPHAAATRRAASPSPCRRCGAVVWRADAGPDAPRRARRAMHVRDARPPAAPSAAAPRSAPPSPTSGFDQVTLRLAPGRAPTSGPRSAPTTTRRTASSTTSPASPKGTLRRVPRGARATAAATCRWPPTYATVGDPPPPAAAPAGGGPVDAARRRVSVPGTHNSEMGCPGDWQPDCDAGPADARPRRRDLEGHVRRCPAGDYAYKVAINGSWDENYGAGGVPGRRQHPATPHPADR